MDLYALELTPKKEKNNKDISKAHVITKGELLADFRGARRNFFGKFVSDKEKNKDTNKEIESESVKKEKTPKDQDKIISEQAAISQSQDEKAKDTFQKVAEKKSDIGEDDKDKKSAYGVKMAPNLKSERMAIYDVRNDKITRTQKNLAKSSVAERTSNFEKQPAYSAIETPGIKAEKTTKDNIKKNNTKEDQKKPEENPVTEKYSKLDEQHQKILNLFVEAIRSGDEQQLHEAIEEIAELRADDEYECQYDAPLNIAIKREIFKSISVALAYKNSREIIRIFQLIDLLNLEMSHNDFSVLPDEVLHSSEIHNIAVKYLMWCAKEYEEFPAEFEKRVACFIRTGILTSTEIHELPELQEAISRSILEYAKNNLKRPLDIERKIYQYSLTGFLNGKTLKKSEKIKDLSMGYLIEMMEKYQDRPEEIEKKIKEYERAGFIERQDLRENEKVQKIIERQLARYMKNNKSHPRKISVRVKEYFKMGLIDKNTTEGYLKQT